MVHNPEAMHISGCNYQKDFSFCSWQRTLFIFVIGTIASPLSQKLISHEVGRGSQTRAADCDCEELIFLQPEVSPLQLPIGHVCDDPPLTRGNWRGVVICVTSISSPKDRNNLILDLDISIRFFFQAQPKKNPQGKQPKITFSPELKPHGFIYHWRFWEMAVLWKHIYFSLWIRDLVTYNL